MCIVFLLCLMIFSKTAMASATKGINLWLNIVFPSLFPFFVASELLNGTGFIRAIGVLLEPVMRPLFNVPGCGSFAFAMGITSGYPVGAKITAGMRKDKLISKIEAERLLAFSNNSGPLFIMGAVAVGMFKSPQLGVFLLICHIAACITVGIIFRFYRREKTQYKCKPDSNPIARFRKELISSCRENGTGFGITLGNAIRNSIMTVLAIGGFIILFSVVINLLLETGVIQYASEVLSIFLIPLGISKDLITAVLSGFFEITTGTNMVSNIAGASIVQQLTAVSIIIGWAGLSVHSQVLSIVSNTDISINPYLLGKFLQGIIAAIYTFVGIKAAGCQILKVEPAFSNISSLYYQDWYKILFSSLRYLLITLLLLSIVILLSYTRSITLKIKNNKY